MQTLWQDLRYGARMLLKHRGFTFVAVLTLALGIGANTAIFSLIDAVLLKLLPVKEPAQLVALTNTMSAGQSGPAFSYPMFQDLRERNQVFTDILAHSGVALNLSGNGQTERVAGQLVSGNFFSVLGVQPLLGRAFSDDDNKMPGAHPVTVLSHSFWQRRFASNPSVVGETVHLNGYPFSSVRVISLQEALVGDVRTMMLVMMGAVGFVVLIACSNLANLLLMAAARRQKEIAVRLSLGANRSRVVRQFLTESLLLAGLGGLAGLLLAYSGMTLINALLPSTIPRNGEISVDGRVLAFTFSLSVTAGLLFGTLPALRASQTALTEALKAGSRTLDGSLGANRLRAALVVSQVALTVVLLTGAGLLIKSFVRLQQTPLGFRPERLLTARIALPRSAYATPQQRLSFTDRLLEEVHRQPGMREAALTSFLPFATGNSSFGVLMNGQEEVRPGMPTANFRAVSPDYFRVMGIPLLKGREFSSADQERAPMVTVINETMAKRYWPNANPIGQRIKETSNERAWREIVGIVGSVRHLARGEEPEPEMFVPYSQVPAQSLNVAVRTQVEPTSFAATLRRAVTAIDANLPLFEVRTMEERLFESVAQPRFRTALLGAFAALALVMALVGLYAVMAFSVAQRTHELGIRVALGAQRRNVIGLVLRQGMKLAGVGVVIGLVGAWALSRVLTTLLYEVKPTDPLTFLFVPILLIAVAALACWLPARQAAKVDPIIALRDE